jgi:hypothetical protein
MKRSIYMLLGWLAWKFGKRAFRRKLHVTGR